MLHDYVHRRVAGESIQLMDLEAVAVSPMVSAPAGAEAYQTWFESIQKRHPFIDPMVWPLMVIVGLLSTDVGHGLLLHVTGPLGTNVQVALALWPMWLVGGIFVWAWVTTSALFFQPAWLRRFRHRRLMRRLHRKPYLYRKPREIGQRSRNRIFAFFEGTAWRSQWEHSQQKGEEWTAELKQIAQEVAQLPGAQTSHRSLHELIASLEQHTVWLTKHHADVTAWVERREQILTDGILKLKRSDDDDERTLVRLRKPRGTRRVRNLVRTMKTRHRRLEQQVQHALHGKRHTPQE